MAVDLVACDSPVNLREDEGAKVRSRSDGASDVEPRNLGRKRAHRGNRARIWGDERAARAHLLSPPSETVGLRLCGLPRFFCGGTGAASPVFSSRSVPIQSCVGFLPRAGILFPSKAVSETFGADPIGGTGAVFGCPWDSRRGVAASPCAPFGEIARDGGCLASASTPRALQWG